MYPLFLLLATFFSIILSLNNVSCIIQRVLALAVKGSSLSIIPQCRKTILFFCTDNLFSSLNSIYITLGCRDGSLAQGNGGSKSSWTKLDPILLFHPLLIHWISKRTVLQASPILFNHVNISWSTFNHTWTVISKLKWHVSLTSLTLFIKNRKYQLG